MTIGYKQTPVGMMPEPMLNARSVALDDSRLQPDGHADPSPSEPAMLFRTSPVMRNTPC
jgi:hypothetical protein